MSTTKLDGRETLSLDVKRLDDEYGSLEMTIETEDDKIVINLGRYCEDAEGIKDILETAAKKVNDEILYDWHDVPDSDSDGWISTDRGEYWVSLEGGWWDGENLVGGNQPHPKTYPSLKIATIELARAMIKTGIFPACWYQHENGYTEEIDDEVRAFHDEGGSSMIELPGVKFKPGDEVRIKGVIAAYTNHPREEYWGTGDVVEDYGDAGVVVVWSGNSEEELIEGHDDNLIHLDSAHEVWEYRQQMLAFYRYRQQILDRKSNA